MNNNITTSARKNIFTTAARTLLFGALLLLACHRTSYAQSYSYDTPPALRQFSDYVIDNIFDGGINRQVSASRQTLSDGADGVVIHISFNGDIVQNNYYDMTFAFAGEAPYIHILKINDIAVLMSIGNILHKLDKWQKQQQ